MKLSLEKAARLLLHDAERYRYILFGMFTVIAAVALVTGLYWPKKFTSYTSIFIEQKSVIQPLMVGAASTMDQRDRASIAKEVLFSRKILMDLLVAGGWNVDEEADPVALERLLDDLKGRTQIQSRGKNLIRIEYTDTDPRRAHLVTSRYAELFISGSMENKINESVEAFNFIDKQAKSYHEKLLEAEHNLKEFRSANPGIRPGSQADVSQRLNALRTRINSIKLELKEAMIRRGSLDQQLRGEASVTKSLGRERVYQQRLADLQSKLDQLRLSYLDTYPDIVILKAQVEELESEIHKERMLRAQSKGKARENSGHYADATGANPLYTALRGELSETKTHVRTLETRLYETEALYQEELERAQRVNEIDETLKELTRDYEVNRDIYQDLARRRENARVTMKLEEQHQGLNFRIEEPATMPVKPQGLRFLHFMIGGLILGVMAPAGFLYAMLNLDPRVRLPSTIKSKLKLPVITSIPHLYTTKERRAINLSYALLATLFVIEMVAYLGVGVLRYQGQI